MPDSRPNILLLMADQMRGDCLGIDGHPVLQTPYLDHIAASGVRFRRAYTACPVCIPARRTLMTGQRPCTHGVVMNYNTRLDAPTLPGELARAGYQTHLVGKLHLWPQRKLYGFCSADWADSVRPGAGSGDYERFLRRSGVTWPRAAVAHGSPYNGFPVRPWHLDERFHFSNWCADCAIEFLERRDPTVPFFLNVSFYHPHQPVTPPACYYERYLGMDLAPPFVGGWARVFQTPVRGLAPEPWRVFYDPQVMRQIRAAYYGTINHIDDQIGRILQVLPPNTIVVFCADHGEMLGDHQWIRKRNAFEPAARIPFLARFPGEMNLVQGCVRDDVVELMDIMPTLLEAAGVNIPSTVEGRSLLPLLRGNGAWRAYVHGECANIPTRESGMEYLTDGRRKYIWYPAQGMEQYFDLEKDPREMTDLAGASGFGDEIGYWRGLLMRELRGRPEGFTDGRELKHLPGPTASCLPGFESR